MSQCKKFAPNIFHKTKCSNCFRQKEEHSAEALECNRASRSIARSGYLFVAPDWDFSVPLNRTKRWQRRWFVLYDDGELNYSVDEHPDTVPQGSVDMSKVLEVTGAEQVTGHPHSLALTSPDRVTFVKAASREDARWWAELLAVFPRRHKRNATFPGGRASPSLPQLGRSASPQPPRPRHLSVTGPSPRTNFETPPLKEERESPPKDEARIWMPERTNNVAIENNCTPVRNDYLVSSGSPPTRDKLQCDDKARARRDWRNERLRDIATALTDRSPESSLALPAEGLLHWKKGWLWLKNDVDEWVRRWVVLCGPTLNIYMEQDEQSNSELVVELSSITSYNEIPTDSKYGFEIHYNNSLGKPVTITLSAVTQGIRSNWLQALKKAAPITVNNTNSSPSAESPVTPSTPRSVFLSSDEEYRTASEGGRRGSEDWSELPPSPPLNRASLNKVKERVRLRPKLPRAQSRQSTVDSTSTDELDCAIINKENNSETVELHNSINKHNSEVEELKTRLNLTLGQVNTMQEEIARLKKLQSDAVIREKRARDMLLNLERTEKELNQRNSQTEVKYLKEQRALQRRLSEAEDLAQSFEEKYNQLIRELQSTRQFTENLQDELTKSNNRLVESLEENDTLLKKICDLEKGYRSMIHVDSISDLTNINLDLDIDEMGHNELKEYCLDLKGRFEKAVLEIRAVKRELRQSYEKCDQLEIDNYALTDRINLINAEKTAEINLLVSRLENLTAKLSSAEKMLKGRGKSSSSDKRRSLSLKGRESFSINKEVEDKVTELEAKILAMERGRNKRKYKRERSSERGSPIDDKSLRRLRRKSLDSATSSEPMKLLMRLSSLESKVTNSTESINTLEKTDELMSSARLKLSECLSSVNALKHGSKSRRSASPSANIDKLENNLCQLADLLDDREMSIVDDEMEVINQSAGAAVKQLQKLLLEKLTMLNEKKRLLKETGKLDTQARLDLLAEKLAFERILINRIQEALNTPSTVSGEAICDRLINKETKETTHLIIALQNKLGQSEVTSGRPEVKTGAEYLAQLLAKSLQAKSKSASILNPIARCSPSIDLLLNQQKRLNATFKSYKSTKLPQLAEALALETINLSNDKSLILSQETIKEFNQKSRDIVNSELIQSEINHILMRAAQIYRANIDADHPYFFSFFASERAALELWSDSVNTELSTEIEDTLDELLQLYQSTLNKLQKQNWRRRLEAERNLRPAKVLLHEFADIVAHKALIDARINVLKDGPNQSYANINTNKNEGNLSNLLEAEMMDVVVDETLEAEFACMLDKYKGECFALLGQPDLEEVVSYLDEIAVKVAELQKFSGVVAKEDGLNGFYNWNDVCAKCKSLRDNLDEIRKNMTPSFKRSESIDNPKPVCLGTEYLTQVENLRAAYRCALASCKERHPESDIEHLQSLCERVLSAMEQWHRYTIQELRESHAQEIESLKQEKEQALAEETQATLAALDAMQKAHEAEVQREVAKFKQEFARQQRDEILDLSERLSVKCLEAAALEEQLGSATRQLAHAQQHILQLERTPQLTSIQN